MNFQPTFLILCLRKEDLLQANRQYRFFVHVSCYMTLSYQSREVQGQYHSVYLTVTIIKIGLVSSYHETSSDSGFLCIRYSYVDIVFHISFFSFITLVLIDCDLKVKTELVTGGVDATVHDLKVFLSRHLCVQKSHINRYIPSTCDRLLYVGEGLIYFWDSVPFLYL